MKNDTDVEQFFKPEIFKRLFQRTVDGDLYLLEPSAAASIANEFLRKHATVVYGMAETDFGDFMGAFRLIKHDQDTHTALLINIKPIEEPDTWEKIGRDLVRQAVGSRELAKQTVENKALGNIVTRACKLAENND